MRSLKYSVFPGVGALLVGMLCTSPALADRLSEIKDRGELVCGTLTTTEPLGFQDPKTRETVGLDVDICKAIADSIGVKLTLKGLSVASRIPELTVGRVDVVAAALGFTKERAEQIEFSDAYYQVPSKIIVRSDAGIEKIEDLAGHKISASKSSTPAMFAAKALPTAHVLTFQDSPSSFLALQQGKVDGMAITLFSGLRYVETSDGTARFLPGAIGYEGEAVGIAKGETALVAAVNAALENLEKTGEMQKIWDKWYGPETKFNVQREKKVTPISAFQ